MNYVSPFCFPNLGEQFLLRHELTLYFWELEDIAIFKHLNAVLMIF